ncbi:MAG: transcription termination factor Rho [Patescibacteria group bacterium]
MPKQASLAGRKSRAADEVDESQASSTAKHIPVVPLKNSSSNNSSSADEDTSGVESKEKSLRTAASHVMTKTKNLSNSTTGSKLNGNSRGSTTHASSENSANTNRYATSGHAGRRSQDQPSTTITGVLDTSRDGHGVLRVNLSDGDEGDAYISTSQIRRFRLRPGDVVTGPAREPKENERYWGLLQVDEINSMPAKEVMNMDRIKFRSLTPVYPDQQIKLETSEEPLSMRMIDLIAPIGKGQRSLIVSPPMAGKTTLLKEISTGVAANHPEIHIMAVLVGERPEEVTDIKRHISSITDGNGETAASNFDESAEDQCRVAELALEKAKRQVEMGRDVLILLDSITRLARAYNLSIPTSGRTLSGGFDPAALFPPKKFFGAARNFEVPGSLTIIGTALVDTGSRMDDLVYEEFKGTGNQEVHLDRRLAERRIYPSIDVQRSGTRRDDLLIDGVAYQSVATLHRMLDMIDREDRTSTLIEQLRKSKSNKDFLASLKDRQ